MDGWAEFSGRLILLEWWRRTFFAGVKALQSMLTPCETIVTSSLCSFCRAGEGNVNIWQITETTKERPNLEVVNDFLHRRVALKLEPVPQRPLDRAILRWQRRS